MSKTTIPTGGITADAIDSTLIADDAVSEEHLDATALTANAELAETPADTDEVLISDGGTLKRIDFSYLKSVAGSAYWSVYRNANQSVSQSTQTTATWNQTNHAVNVTNSASSNGRITIPSGYACKYAIYVASRYADGPTDGKERLYITQYDTSASGTVDIAYGEMNTKGTYDTCVAMGIADLAVGDYVYCEVWQNNDSTANFIGGRGGFFGIKIAD